MKNSSLKSQFQIIPIIPKKSQSQNPKLNIGIWDFGFILDLVVFGFWICHVYNNP